MRDRVRCNEMLFGDSNTGDSNTQSIKNIRFAAHCLKLVSNLAKQEAIKDQVTTLEEVCLNYGKVFECTMKT